MTSHKIKNSKAPQALASSAFGALAALAFLSNSAGVLGFLARLPQIAVWSIFATGIHSVCHLKREDYLEGVVLAGKCLTAGYAQTGLQEQIAPVVNAIAELPGLDRFTSKVEFDVSDIVERSAMIVAPTGTGKSFLLSLLMVERQRIYPGASWRVCSINNWKRGQTWMGLKDCPQWLQDKYLGFGNKYLDESEVAVATHRETDDCVDALYAELQRRQRVVQQTKGDCGQFEFCTLLIDEFPIYFDWLGGHAKGKERKAKIRELLTTGHGYQCLLVVIAVDDAVGMLGLNQAEQKQLMLLRPIAPGLMGQGAGFNEKEVEYINTFNCRRLFVRWDSKVKLMPVPHCESEPVLDWSKAIAQGEFYSWLDGNRGAIANAKQSGMSLTKVWQSVLAASDFPESGNRRQGDDNFHYKYFKKLYQEV